MTTMTNLVAAVCMLMLLVSPLSASAQRPGADRDRTEQHRGNGKRSDKQRTEKQHNAKQRTDKQHADKQRAEKRTEKRADQHKQGVRPNDGVAHKDNPKPNAGRPGSVHNNAVAPNNNRRPNPSGPAHNWNPGHPNKVQPGHAIHRPAVAPPPMRPYRPSNFYGYHRPSPPRGWKPGPRPLFSSVLGLTFGVAINTAIDALITNGYVVDGYTDNAVYVNDAVQLNMRWPFGVLYYDGGLLAASEFTYSSVNRDMHRYNQAFARLSGLYGAPVSSYHRGNEWSATWWGPGGQYVTLRFDRRRPMEGPKRYFTTLSFGI